MSLFLFPASTHGAILPKVLPKTRIFEKSGVSKAVQRRFSREIEKVTWEHVLSSRTLNLMESPSVKEIQVFRLDLRTESPDSELLRLLDAAIPSPLVLELVHGHRIRMAMAWKRPHRQDPARKVVGEHFFGPWEFLPGTREMLPVVADLGALQERLFQSLLAFPVREGEALTEHLARMEEYQSLEREAARLRQAQEREVQFNRKMELHRSLLVLEAREDALRS